MGHTRTCNFHVNVNVSGGKQLMAGANSFRDVKGLLLSEIEYQKSKGGKVLDAEIWAQTKAGERYLKGFDFAILDNDFKISYHKQIKNKR